MLLLNQVLFLTMFIAAPQVVPVEVSTSSEEMFVFDWDGKDVDGNDFTGTLTKVVFRYTPSDTGAAQRWVSVVGDYRRGVIRIAMKDALKSVSPGLYDMQVLVEDEVNDVTSSYSEALSINVVAPTRPTRPSNLRVGIGAPP